MTDALMSVVCCSTRIAHSHFSGTKCGGEEWELNGSGTAKCAVIDCAAWSLLVGTAPIMLPGREAAVMMWKTGG